MNLRPAALLSAALAAALSFTNARAASVDWTGGGNNLSWYDGGNWSSGAQPAAGDDVSIASSTLVDISLGVTVDINSLTLGDGVSSPTLRVRNAIVNIGTLTVASCATLRFDTDQFSTMGSVVIASGAVLTQGGPVQSATVAVRMQVTTFELQAGATIALNGKGFAGGAVLSDGFGPSPGIRGTSFIGAGGAGHGSLGGDGSNAGGSSGFGGAATDSQSHPAVMGSGGGAALAPCSGGAGGGVFELIATTAVLNGLIEADGLMGQNSCGAGAGGGAGGSIYIEAQYILGTGTFTALGGGGGAAGSTGGGGGSGGRIALRILGDTTGYFSTAVGGGAGGPAPGPGGIGAGGTVYADPKIYLGNAGGGCNTAANWFSGLVPTANENVLFGSSNPLNGCSWNLAPVGGKIGSLTIASDFQGIIEWSATLCDIGGDFNIAGGTFTSTDAEMKVAGDWNQTGGEVLLDIGTVTFNGSSAQSISQLPGSYFRNFKISGAAGSVSQQTDILIRGNTTLGSRFANSNGSFKMRLRGALLDTPPTAVGNTDWVLEGTSPQVVSTGPYFALTVNNAAGVSFSGAGPPAVGPGGLLIGPGAILDATGRDVETSGDFTISGGTFVTSGSTLSFVSSTQSVTFNAPDSLLNHVDIRLPGGTLVWETSATIAGNMTLSTGTLSVAGGSTLTVRGDWRHIETAAFSPGTGTVVFAGSSPQVVFSTAAASFHQFHSSNATTVTLSTHTDILGDLEMHVGTLAFPGIKLSVGGDFLNVNAGNPAAGGSTVTMGGAVSQTLDLGILSPALDSLVISNSSSGVVLGNNLEIRRDFTITSGATFYAQDHTLSMTGDGAVWDTAGANYYSAGNSRHIVRWDPAGGGETLYVAAGSTVAARIDAFKNVVLTGELNVTGNGNRFNGKDYLTLRATGTVIRLGDEVDFEFPAFAAYVHDADSWIVFDGSGTGRGLLLSTGPFANIRLAPEDPASTFVFNDLFLDGSLVIDGGHLSNNGDRTLVLSGDLLNNGGTVQFSLASTGTVRFAGVSDQSVSLQDGDDFAGFEVDSSSYVVLTTGRLRVKGDLVLSSGTLRAGNARIDIERDWSGGGGGFLAETSTVVFSSAGATASAAINDVHGLQFNGLAIQVSSMVFHSTFTANILTSTRPGTWLQFAPAGDGAYTAGELKINGNSLSDRIRMRSVSPGVQFNLTAVTVSSVTAADIQDVNAVGSVIHANDGDSVDSGNNINVNFLPVLMIVAPGETFTEGFGKSGSPTTQTAGTPFTVTVRAVSDRFRTRANAVATVSVADDDPYDVEPAAANLSVGVRAFTLDLRVAEPSPFPATVSANSAQVYAGTTCVVGVAPAAFNRLQLTFEGEMLRPGSPSGMSAVPNAKVIGLPFGARVRAVDAYWNLIPGAADTVELSTANISSVTLPSPAAMSGGSALFTGIIAHTTDSVHLRASDITNIGIAGHTGQWVVIFGLSASSPAVSLGIPQDAVVPTLGGALVGTASDSIAVAEVRVAIEDSAAGKFFDWTALTFSSAVAGFTRAAVNPQNNPQVEWTLDFPDARLVSGKDYYVVIQATNPSQFTTNFRTTFTFDTGALRFSPGDGMGTAAVLPSDAAGCRPITSTVSFVVGAGGIGRGGAIALRIPDGWSRLKSTTGATPRLGEIRISAASPAYPAHTEALLNPPTYGDVKLGDRWVVLRVKDNAGITFFSGDVIDFAYRSFPPLGTAGLGEQVYDLRTQGSAAGALVSISTVPKTLLGAGPPNALRFSDQRPMVLGPLQTSATMQLRVTDICGNPAPVGGSVTAMLSAGVPSTAAFARDTDAEFFLAGGTPVNGVTIAAGDSESESFYFRTSTTEVSFELLRATAVLTDPVVVDRPVELRASSNSLTGVSIDSGTLIPGATSVLIVPGVPGSRAVVRFSLPDRDLRWEVDVATDATFSPAVFSASGFGDAQRPVQVDFDGMRCERGACGFLPPGAYPARVRVSGSAAAYTPMEVRVGAAPMIFGRLRLGGGAAGGAMVRADGPGKGPGSFAVASSTGFFQIFGLRAGGVYTLTAATETFAYGETVTLSTRIFGVAVSSDIGVRDFPSASLIRVNVGIPIAAPVEFFGRVSAHDADFSHQAFGTLHFSSGRSRSDDGRTALSLAASTWTVLSLPPGTYDLDIDLTRVGVTTRIAGVALAQGGLSDFALQLTRPSNVYGYVVLPSTRPFGTPVTVRALLQGATVPSVFAGAYVQPSTASVAVTSAAYGLFGLTPGTWTFTAQGEGFVSVSSTRCVAQGIDIGDPVWGVGNLDFNLGLGGVIAGTVTVTGDTTGLSDPPEAIEALSGLAPGFSVFVTAYDPATFEHHRVRVRMPKNSSVTQGTYTLSGLASGTYTLRAFLQGFERTPPGPETVVLGSAAFVNFDLAAESGGIRFIIELPPAAACRPSSDYDEIGLLFQRPGGEPEVYGDIGLFDSVHPSATEERFCSTMTLTVPDLGSGVNNFKFMHGPSGNAKDLFVASAGGETTDVRVGLAESTYTVSGTVSLAGVVQFHQLGAPAGGTSMTGFSVLVSSIAGLAAQSLRTDYCLLSSSLTVALNNARVELVPLDRRTGRSPGALYAPPGTHCASYNVAPSSVGSPSVLAYAADIGSDGSYAIAGVPAGAYILRVPGDLDGDPGTGNEVAPADKIINVAGDTTEDLRIGNGARISGRIFLPPGAQDSRAVAVTLGDAEGRTLRRKVVNFANEAAVPYVFAQLANGAYAVKVEDAGEARAFAASPLNVILAGADLDGQDIRLVHAGRIRGRIAVEKTRPDGSRDYVVITRENRDLLPAGLSIAAAAVPWFRGGHFAARGEECGDAGCERVAIDSEGAFIIPGVLPGVYDVEFNAVNDVSNGRRGRLDIVSACAAGVDVAARRTTDLEVVRLRAGVTLSGRVTDAATGAGLANIPVKARPASQAPGGESGRAAPPETRSGRDGQYELRGLDAELRFYDVIAAERAEGLQAGEIPAYERRVLPMIDLRSTATLNIALAAADFAVTGRVVSSGGGGLYFAQEGESFPGARLYLHKDGVIATRNPFGDITARGAADGSFVIPGLAPGSYRLTATAVGHVPARRGFSITVSSADVGTLELVMGATLTGSLRNPDGSAPGEDEIEAVLGATPDQSEVLFGTLTTDPNSRTVTGYRLSGFKRDTVYRIVLITPNKDVLLPDEGNYVVFESSIESRGLDLTFQPRPPLVLAKSRRSGADFLLDFRIGHALRARTLDDDDLALILSTVSAQGSLKDRELSSDRKRLRAVYSPSVGESSFTLRLRAYSALRDPDSSDTANAEFTILSTFSFHAGLDGYHRTSIPNLSGGSLAIEGDNGRVDLPEKAFFVDPSSAVLVTFQRSNELLTGAERFAAEGFSPAAANLRSLRYGTDAYPPGVLSAMAATPPRLDPLSAFYDILLPLGVRTALANPVEISLTYAQGADPGALNVYWYNEAANAYVLQQDVTGAAPVIDTANRTISIKVNHFSTFVLFETGVSVISGSAFGGGEIEAYNFPNPFDLAVKTVTPLHGIAAQSVRGTMIRISLPGGVSGEGRLNIFNVAGQRVRVIDLGNLRGGQTYYQPWDGRNDSGRDAASGVYFGQVKAGGAVKFFKMAVIE